MTAPLDDGINYPPPVVTRLNWVPPAWFWVLAVLWSIGAAGGIWYIVERIADAS